MSENRDIKLIVVTGPESTGKTELSENLAKRLGTSFVPEYAREYVENLGRKYTYEDVENIAKYQIAQENIFREQAQRLLIFDTWLIITKVWFDLVFGECPDWLIAHIKASRIDLFLVCDTDLPWIPDSVRENGGEKREQLFRRYCDEIESFGFKYEVVNGKGSDRLKNALIGLRSHGLINNTIFNGVI